MLANFNQKKEYKCVARSCVFRKEERADEQPITAPADSLPAGWLLYVHGSLSIGTFITTIVLYLGIAGPLLTAMNFVDSLAKVGTIVDEVDSNVCHARAEEVEPSTSASTTT